MWCDGGIKNYFLIYVQSEDLTEAQPLGFMKFWGYQNQGLNTERTAGQSS